MIATRSATRCTSSSACDDSSTARPSPAVSRNRRSNSIWTSGSSPVVGSSRITTSGLCMKASRSPTFCLLPLDNSRTGRSKVIPNRSTISAVSSSSWPPRAREHHDTS